MASRHVLAVSFVLLGAVSTASATDLTVPLTFIGITPCRIFDTRGGAFTGQAGAPSLAADTARTFQITGTVPGVPTQCGIPTTALAVSVNFTATNFSAQGNIRAYPAGGAAPLASILNYQLENIANATVVPLGASGITVRSDAANTDLLADVNGYFVALASPGTCGTNDVSVGGHCYYLDGSAGKCDPGYQLVSQSVLGTTVSGTTIAARFNGKTYKHTVSDNCCIYNLDPVENWGISDVCNGPVTFTATSVSLGGASCTGAVLFTSKQLTLCGK